MNNKKLNLADLKISSFVTASQEVQGGRKKTFDCTLEACSYNDACASGRGCTVVSPC